MSRRQKRRNPAGGRGPRKAQPGKLQADPTLVRLLAQGIEMEDRHCLLLHDAAGQSRYMVSGELMRACEAAGMRARAVCPADPAAAIYAALAVLQSPAGGVH